MLGFAFMSRENSFSFYFYISFVCLIRDSDEDIRRFYT